MNEHTTTKQRFAFLHKTVDSFSYSEKIIFWILVGVLAISTLTIVGTLHKKTLITVPKEGGVFHEGLVGSARFMNPVLAQSDTDLDITQLVYSGLMRISTNGELIPDLASSYEVSEDGLTYTFSINPESRFHDGTPVTANDILFTIVAIQDPIIKSPKRSNWDGITVQKIDDKTIAFSLDEPYAPFIWNTTLGILPSHIWSNVSSEEFSFNTFNTNPIGSGPYVFNSVKRDKSGTIKTVILERNKDFLLGTPFIKEVVFHIFKNNTERIAALEHGHIDAVAGLNPEIAESIDTSSAIISEFPMNRLFGVFFNQNHAQRLAKKYLREALQDSIDKNLIIKSALLGHGTVARGPIPDFHTPFPSLISTEESPITPDYISIQNRLIDAGWNLRHDGLLSADADNESSEKISLSLSTADVPELITVAEHIVEMWRSVGIDASVKVFNANDLRQNVIRPRDYDVLLFGEVIDPSLDLYAFWHSSQRNDPGLNIANYTNIDVDSSLEKIRKGQDDASYEASLKKIITELEADIPAVFLYSPNMIYFVPDKLQGMKKQSITRTSDRFNSVHTWYIETDTIWKFLTDN